MNEQAIRKIVDDEIKKKLFQLPKIPPHKHDGTDNIRIFEDNVIPTIATMGKIKFAQQTIYTLYYSSAKPNLISFNGFALQQSSQTTVTFTILSKGATFGTLTSVWSGSNENITLTFSDGETRLATFTNGSLTVDWEPGLANNVANTATYSIPSQYAMIVGNAVIGKTNYFNPYTSTSVSTGNLKTYPLASPLPGVGIELAQNCSYLYQDNTDLANSYFGVDQFNIISVSNLTETIAVGTLTNPTATSVDLNMRVLASGWEVVGNFTLT